MANISIKKDFEDGQKLFAQQLNNNFETIELGINAGNKLIWKDDNGAEFQTFRGTTEEIENRPIIDGQELYNIENGDTFLDVGETRKVMNKPLWKDDNGAQVQSFRGTTAEVAARPIIDGQTLYNIETGETALDVGNNRISTGAGNVVYIGDEEPQNDATKIWIENDQVLNLGSEVAISSKEPTTQEKVWIQRSRNLFDKNNIILNKYLNNDSSENTSSVSSISNFCKVKENTKYTINYGNIINYYKVVHFYDSSKTFLSYFTITDDKSITTIETPSNCEYLRFHFHTENVDVIQLEQGSVATSYEPYTPKKIHTKTDNGYEELTKTISLGLSANDAEIWLQKGKNLFNPNTDVELIDSFRSYYDEGGITQASGFYGLKIRVKPNTTYATKANVASDNYHNLCYFDENMVFLTSEPFNKEPKIFTTPDNCVYITIAIRGTYDGFEIEEGASILPKKIHTKTDNGYEEFYSEENREVYSTEEQRIGTWIDGKPLYRRVLGVPETNINSSSITIINFNLDSNVDVKKMNGFLKTQTSNYGFNLSYNGVCDGFRMRLFNNTVQILASEDVAAEKKITSGNIIVEYTKTTD